MLSLHIFGYNEGGFRQDFCELFFFSPMVRLFPGSTRRGHHPDPELLTLTLALTLTRGLLGWCASWSLCLKRLSLLFSAVRAHPRKFSLERAVLREHGKKKKKNYRRRWDTGERICTYYLAGLVRQENRERGVQGEIFRRARLSDFIHIRDLVWD